jgi:probable rRNA maturation factor
VLSFVLGKQEGEILISVETAREQAKELCHSLDEELLTLAIHGFLHLSGYDDHNAKERRRMFSETRRILRGCKNK